MERNSNIYRTYVEIMKKELVCAMGCTEPIAIAYCAAAARAALGSVPDKVAVYTSGNMIKNAKSAVVPNTRGKHGIEAAAAIGIVAGNEKLALQVISDVKEDELDRFEAFLRDVPITVEMSDTPFILDILVEVYGSGQSASTRIVNDHANIACIKRNNVIIFGAEPEESSAAENEELDYSLLNVDSILDFAETCCIDDVKELLDRQIEMNMSIADEGIAGNYGACIGKTYLKNCGDGVRTRAKAYAAAGSDARMNGCEMPVVINSGSGNQGITVSVPVIQYARELRVGQEKLYRALVISNLISLHEKAGIGRLSAYCGAISAGAAAGAAITYLLGGGKRCISETVINALAVTSGIVCDGAKSSCAAKIATAVEAGIMGGEMSRSGHRFQGGDGLVKDSVEDSISSFSKLARDGMRSTDKEIIKLMIQ